MAGSKNALGSSSAARRQLPSYKTIIPALLLVASTFISVTQARRGRGDGPHYRTAYACEGSQLSIACEEGHFIHLIRANYGRFSIGICNEHGSLDWSVDCMSRLSFRVMQESCGMKSGCSLPASSTVFGDPCPGTLKYLEAHYQCMPDSPSSTRRPPPPPIVFPPTGHPPAVLPGSSSGGGGGNSGTGNVNNPATSSSATTGGSGLYNNNNNNNQAPNHHPPPPINVSYFPQHSSTPGTTTTTTTLGPAVIKPQKPESVATPSPNSAGTKTVTSKILEIERDDFIDEPTPSPIPQRPILSTTDLSTDYCNPIRSRNLYWNWTRAGDTAIQKCPGGARGDARWHCSMQSTRWYPDRPDLGGCSSPWVDNLEDRIQEGDSVVNIAADFALITRTKPLYGGDIVQAMGIIQRLISKMEDRVIEFPDEKQRYLVVKELVQSVVDIGSNLLDISQSEAWQDLSDVEQREAASALLHGLERNVRLLADTQNREGLFSHAQNNILVTMNIVRAQTVTDLKLPSVEAISSTTWSQMEDSVYLPAGALLETSRNGLAKAVFLSYNAMDEILSPAQPPAIYRAPKMVGGSEAEDIPVSQIVNSRVVTVSLGRERVVRLSEPVVIVLKNLRVENVTNPKCVYWDFSRRGWSEKGCQVRMANRTHTVCACSHLTNFAVLMDVTAIPMHFGHELALRVITYVGCIVSIICLVLTILTFQLFRGLKSDRTTIHKNLCFCLLVAELVFVAGINQTHLRELCGVIAGVLHYFFLAAFLWMFLEGFQLYVMLVEVFESEKSRVRWYYLAAYLIPAVIVGISAVIDPYSYGSERYCWLRADNYFIFSFVGPVIAILLANIVFLTIAIYMMCRHANMSVVTKTKEQAKLTSICVWIRGAMVLVFLLGLTWAFGLLYLSAESVVMAYVFTILNSLQGLFIFVFHCLKNEKVQKEYQKFIRHVSWLPECIRGSKTQEQRSSFYVHSNGTVSGGQGNSSSQLTSSQQHSWLSKDRSTNGNSGVPKSTTQDETINGQNSEANEIREQQQSTLPRTLKHHGINSKTRSNNTLHSNNQQNLVGLHQGMENGTIDPNIVASSNTLPAYAREAEFRALLQHAQQHGVGIHPKHHQHHSPPPPYGGTMSGGFNPFLDHIYECIDTDCETPTYKKRFFPANTAYRNAILQNEGHARSASESSRQSSTSSNIGGCDQKPLILPYNTNGGPLSSRTPQRNAIANLAQVLNANSPGMLLHSPTGREAYLRQQQPTFNQSLGLNHSDILDASGYYRDENASSEDLSGSMGNLQNIQNGYHLADPQLVANSGENSPISSGISGLPSPHPGDNSATVMAVLDGERVVCRLSPDMASSQQSLNSPNSRTHYCHKFSHLSTDC